jgi:hypothetical protein
MVAAGNNILFLGHASTNPKPQASIIEMKSASVVTLFEGTLQVFGARGRDDIVA